MVSIIRELPISGDEDINTYKWSKDGKYLAKKFRTELRKEGTDEVKIKEGITVHELPSMEILKNAQGQKKSITIPGIREWHWSPKKNILIYSCFFAPEEDEDDYDDEEEKKERPEKNQQYPDPKVGFMSIPSR